MYILHFVCAHGLSRRLLWVLWFSRGGSVGSAGAVSDISWISFQWSVDFAPLWKAASVWCAICVMWWTTGMKGQRGGSAFGIKAQNGTMSTTHHFMLCYYRDIIKRVLSYPVKKKYEVFTTRCHVSSSPLFGLVKCGQKAEVLDAAQAWEDEKSSVQTCSLISTALSFSSKDPFNRIQPRCLMWRGKSQSEKY